MPGWVIALLFWILVGAVVVFALSSIQPAGFEPISVECDRAQTAWLEYLAEDWNDPDHDPYRTKLNGLLRSLASCR